MASDDQNSDSQTADDSYGFAGEAQEAIAELRGLLGGVSAEEVIQRALGDELYIRRRIARGFRFVMEKGRYRREVWSATP